MLLAAEDRRIAVAQAETARARVEVERTYAQQLERDRLFVERLANAESTMREREANAAAQAQGESFEALQDQLDALRVAHNETVEQLMTAAQGAATAAGLEPEQHNVFLQALAPAIPQLLQAVVTRFGGEGAGAIAGQVAGAGAAAARARAATPPARPALSGADFFDGLRPPADAAE
jgi:hypothetical protein